jgi:hypothetical protein
MRRQHRERELAGRLVLGNQPFAIDAALNSGLPPLRAKILEHPGAEADHVGLRGNDRDPLAVDLRLRLLGERHAVTMAIVLRASRPAALRRLMPG